MTPDQKQPQAGLEGRKTIEPRNSSSKVPRDDGPFVPDDGLFVPDDGLFVPAAGARASAQPSQRPGAKHAAATTPECNENWPKKKTHVDGKANGVAGHDHLGPLRQLN